MSQFPSTSILATADSNTEEPSPIDKRLTEGRSYNDGNWTSEELKQLVDGLTKYSTSTRAINYISQHYVLSRTNNEIKIKLFEIREMASENKEECREYYKNIWIEKGHRNIETNPEHIVHSDLNWTRIIEMAQSQYHYTLTNTAANPIKNLIQNVLKTSGNEVKNVENAKITDSIMGRAETSETQNIRWSQIYKFLDSCAEVDAVLPELNELEAAIVLNMMESIEDEAATMTNTEKSVYCGIFSEFELNDLRAFEPDHPPTGQNSANALIDPLRTRLFGIPEVAAEPEQNA